MTSSPGAVSEFNPIVMRAFPFSGKLTPIVVRASGMFVTDAKAPLKIATAVFMDGVRKLSFTRSVTSAAYIYNSDENCNLKLRQ